MDLERLASELDALERTEAYHDAYVAALRDVRRVVARLTSSVELFQQGAHDGFWPGCDRALPHTHETKAVDG